MCRRCTRVILDSQQKLTSYGRKARSQCRRLTRDSSSTKDSPDVQAGGVFLACRVAKRGQNVNCRAICGSYHHKKPGKSTKNGPTVRLELTTSRLQVGCATNCAKSAWAGEGPGREPLLQRSAATEWEWARGSGWSRTRHRLPAARTGRTRPVRRGIDSRKPCR